jgi:uncharacterized phage-like protein YoqJ
MAGIEKSKNPSPAYGGHLPLKRGEQHWFIIDSTDFKLLVYLEEKTSLKKSFVWRKKKKR